MRIFFLLLTTFLIINGTVNPNSAISGKKETRKVAITIDDLPLAAAKKYPFEKQKEIIDKLIDINFDLKSLSR